MKEYPSQARLKELFDYDEAGFLVWRDGPRAGARAGSFGVNKEMRFFYDVRIAGILYSGAKLIFVYFFGYAPKYIYHKNHDQHDNSVKNLAPSDKRNGHNAGHWKDFSREFRYIEKEKCGKSWFNTIGNRRWFMKKEAAASFANMEIDRLGLNYHRNEIKKIDIEKFACHGHRQVKNRNNKTSEYLGVSKNKNKFVATCAHKYIGIYAEQEQAARAYNIAAHEHYGEHAVLNDIPDPLGHGDPF